ncbi:hypothetical protein ACFYUV_32700 [Nonomuraea sp. NPDC003560]|uniref:hypothetical protein n=1 Tax=Nonomuraea sp. NPDC003560 TaxID=3364341 RepID=UPI0036C879BB
MPRFEIARISTTALLLSATLAVATPPAHAVQAATSAAFTYDPKCQFRAARKVGNNWHISEGGGNLLRSGEEVCQTGAAKLIMQSDGNLVLYNNGRAVWAANTTETLTKPSGYRAEFQTDGNFVVYAYNPPIVRWASNTWSTCSGSAVCELVIQADGNVVIYNMSNSNKVVWDAW